MSAYVGDHGVTQRGAARPTRTAFAALDYRAWQRAFFKPEGWQPPQQHRKRLAIVSHTPIMDIYPVLVEAGYTRAPADPTEERELARIAS